MADKEFRDPSAPQDGQAWHGARQLIRVHGLQAASHAARTALSLIAAGDKDGYLVWLRMLQAVDILLDEREAPAAAA